MARSLGPSYLERMIRILPSRSAIGRVAFLKRQLSMGTLTAFPKLFRDVIQLLAGGVDAGVGCSRVGEMSPSSGGHGGFTYANQAGRSGS